MPHPAPPLTPPPLAGEAGWGAAFAAAEAAGEVPSRRFGSRARKKSGPPGGGPPVSPGKGTAQKLRVMPVTKPLPSFLPPVTFVWPVVSSTPKTEVFHATPGAIV